MSREESEFIVSQLTEKVGKLETNLKTSSDNQLKLESRLQKLEDIESVKKLQRCYCYYLEHWQSEEILNLFSHSDEVSVELNETGLYKGWEQVKKSFSFPVHYTGYNGEKTAPPEF